LGDLFVCPLAQFTCKTLRMKERLGGGGAQTKPLSLFDASADVTWRHDCASETCSTLNDSFLLAQPRAQFYSKPKHPADWPSAENLPLTCHRSSTMSSGSFPWGRFTIFAGGRASSFRLYRVVVQDISNWLSCFHILPLTPFDNETRGLNAK
jgi:hypothetical protein